MPATGTGGTRRASQRWSRPPGELAVGPPLGRSGSWGPGVGVAVVLGPGPRESGGRLRRAGGTGSAAGRLAPSSKRVRVVPPGRAAPRRGTGWSVSSRAEGVSSGSLRRWTGRGRARGVRGPWYSPGLTSGRGRAGSRLRPGLVGLPVSHTCAVPVPWGVRPAGREGQLGPHQPYKMLHCSSVSWRSPVIRRRTSASVPGVWWALQALVAIMRSSRRSRSTG